MNVGQLRVEFFFVPDPLWKENAVVVTKTNKNGELISTVPNTRDTRRTMHLLVASQLGIPDADADATALTHAPTDPEEEDAAVT